MNYEDDFVNDDIVTLNVDGKEFKYKPATAEDENNWLNRCLSIDEKTKKTNTDWATYNRCKLENIVGVPYDQETINKFTGLTKEWNKLTKDEQWDVFRKLNTNVFNKLINAIRLHDEPDTEIKKN
ncbi:hypothetical protein GQ473_01135 [archaeon]|nr:hypothetical protein [archaeon]